MSRGFGTDPDTGREWFDYHGSSNERGFWIQGEPRFGVSAEDAKRYRKRTLTWLQNHGYASPDLTHDTTLDWIEEPNRRNIELRAELGYRADGLLSDETPRTIHTMLGRMRETKRYGYLTRRQEVQHQLEAAGLDDDDVDDVLDAWDNERDIRVESERKGNRTIYRVFDDGDKQIGGDFDDLELTELAVAGTEFEGQFASHKRAELAAQDIVDQLAAEGIDPLAAGWTWQQIVEAPAEVASQMRQAGALVVTNESEAEVAADLVDGWEELDDDEAAELGDFPF